MLLLSTLCTCVLLSRVESKKPDKAVTELLSSLAPRPTPPPADTGDRQEVSVKTKMEDQGPQWPVREMIAILGGYIFIKCTIELELQTNHRQSFHNHREGHKGRTALIIYAN